jgi:uncharacterized protein YuzE
MQLEFDLDAGALYIRLMDAEIVRTREAGDNAAVDLDATGGVVGIEVISAAHPWPVADILATYPIPDGEAAQIRNYFARRGLMPMDQEPAKIGVASPPPARLLVPACV